MSVTPQGTGRAFRAEQERDRQCRGARRGVKAGPDRVIWQEGATAALEDIAAGPVTLMFEGRR